MNEIDLYKSISTQSSPVYFMSGDERYSIEKAIDMAKGTLKESFRELNFTVIDSECDTDMDMVINSCESIPFMDEKRIVVVKNSELFQVGANKYCTKEQIQKISNYIESPSKSTIVIFAPIQADKRSELYKLIKKKYDTYQSDRLDKLRFSTWVSNKFKEKNVSIDKNTIDYFVQKSGYLFRESQVTLFDVESEIEKLSTTFSHKQVSMVDIEKISSTVEENDMFKFVDYVFVGDIQKAYSIMRNISNNTKNSILAMSLIARQISILLKILVMKRNRLSQEEMASFLMMHPFVVKKSIAQLKYYTYHELISLYDLCSDIDYRIKKGQIKDNIGLEVVVNKICKNKYVV